MEPILQDFIIQLGVILFIATILGIILKHFKQPLILAYIFTGIIGGPSILNLIKPGLEISLFASLGASFLLFIAGMSLSSGVLKDHGKIAVLTGTGQVVFTFLIGSLLALSLGFGILSSLYISIALTFSSTIIIVSILSEKKDLNSLHGKIAVGFLLVQDFIAIMLFVILNSNLIAVQSLLIISLVKMGILLAITFALNKFLIPPLFDRISINNEMLFLGGLSWMFVMSILSVYLGFTMEIGALLAGIALASIPNNSEINKKIRPLRDFFLILFFVYLGSQMASSMSINLLFPIAVFSLYVLVGNPLIMMAIMGFFGYKKRTSFLCGLTASQISEFSFLLILVGVSLGHLPAETIPLISWIGIITITISSYLTYNAEKIFNRISPYLNIFERRHAREEPPIGKKKYDIVLIGYDRAGYMIMRDFKKMEKVLIVDFNPETIRELKHEGKDSFFGDISDPEVVDRVLSVKPKLIISTVPNYDDNAYLINSIKSSMKNTKIFTTTDKIHDALKLYHLGAVYVIMPHYIGAKKASMLLEEFLERDFKDIALEKKRHISELREFIKRGHF